MIWFNIKMRLPLEQRSSISWNIKIGFSVPAFPSAGARSPVLLMKMRVRNALGTPKKIGRKLCRGLKKLWWDSKQHPDSGFRIRIQNPSQNPSWILSSDSGFRFWIQITILNPDSESGFWIQILDSDSEFGFWIQFLDSESEFRIQNQNPDSESGFRIQTKSNKSLQTKF